MEALRIGATFENENPAVRGSNLGLFQSSTVDDVAEAIAAAAAALAPRRRLPIAARQERIADFLRLLEDSREELARIVTLENGKTIRESRAEVDSALVEGTYHLNQVGGVPRRTGPGAFARRLHAGCSTSRSAWSASSARGTSR